MKALCIAILAVTCGFAEAQTLDAGGFYVSADGTPYTGKMVKMQGENKVELSLVGGQPEGPAFYYFPSGKLMEAGNFSAGQKHHKWVRYNEKGGIAAIAFYNLGKKTGTWVVFDDGGNKRFEMTYENGQKSGLWTSWDENGKVLSTKDYSKVN